MAANSMTPSRTNRFRRCRTVDSGMASREAIFDMELRAFSWSARMMRTSIGASWAGSTGTSLTDAFRRNPQWNVARIADPTHDLDEFCGSRLDCEGLPRRPGRISPGAGGRGSDRISHRGGESRVAADRGYRRRRHLHRRGRRRPVAGGPLFLAPRRRIVGIPERVDATGRVIQPLDEEAVVEAVGRLRDTGVAAIAVCYLFSFLEPAHERRTAALIRQHFPGLEVSLSSTVDPQFREYERLVVTAFDAYLRPVI